MLNRLSRLTIGGISLAALSRPGLARTLAAATLGSVGVRFGGMALTFLVGVLLARNLGPAQYGIYGTVMALAAVLSVPGQFGLPQLATREISAAGAVEDHSRVRSVIVWFTRIVFAGSLLMMALGALGYQLWRQDGAGDFGTAFHWSLGNLMVIAVVALGMGILRGLHRVIGAQAYDAVLRPGFMLIVLASAILLGAVIDARTAMAMQVVTGAIVAIILAVHILRALPAGARAAFTGPFDGNWLKSAAPMTGTELLRMLDGQYPILLLGLLAPIEEVGVFRVAMAMAAFVGLPIILVNHVMMPQIAKFHALGDRVRLQKLARTSALVVFSGVGLITLAILLLGKVFISTVFGSGYIGSWLPLLLIGIGYMVGGFFGIGFTILNMCGFEGETLKIYAIVPMAGALITFGLYPVVGINAAPIAMIATQFVLGLFFLTTARRHLQIGIGAFF